MSEDVRTHRSASDYPNAAPLNQPDGQEWEEATASGMLAGPEPISVERYANRLMDDLFGDLERALEGSLQLPNTPLSPTEGVALKRLALAELSLPPIVPPAQDWPFAQPAAAPPQRSRQVPETTRTLPTARQGLPRRRWQKRCWRLLFGLGLISLVAGVGVWSRPLENRQRVRAWLAAIAPSPAPPTATPTPPANPDAEFSRYLQRALAMIEQQPNSGSTIAAPAVPNSINLAPPLVPPLIPSLSPLPTSPLETPVGDRVYVPIYPTSQSPAANPPTRVPLPAQIPAVPTVPQSVPLPANLPVLPTPTASATTASSPSPATSATKYTLVGVLELGDRSTALFESNGVARRINIGESIGTSGWSLVEVNNQEAIIRRNGEVRSIYVGQSF